MANEAKQNLTCGVPNCYSSRKDGISLYRIPQDVRASESLMKKWAQAIGRIKPFPKTFLICSKHFDKSNILKGVTAAAKLSRLTQRAVPTKNLPFISGRSSNRNRFGKIYRRPSTDARKEETHENRNESSTNQIEEDTIHKLLETSEEEISQDVLENTTHQIIDDLSDVEVLSEDLQEYTNYQSNEKDSLGEYEEEVLEELEEIEAELSSEDLASDDIILEDIYENTLYYQDNEYLSEHLEEESTTHKPKESSVERLLKIETPAPEPKPEPEKIDKSIQVNFNSGLFVGNTALWDTDKKLNIMTGLDDYNTLNILIKACHKIRPTDKMLMSIKDRILLTMYKLKTNCYFSELAITFELSDKSAKLYFADTIKLLTKATKGLIYWQKKEKIKKNSPRCFKSFSNVRSVINCLEINTVYFQTLECKSHYKGSNTLHVLIGVSPSGYVNYLSKVESEESPSEIKFNLSDLIAKMEPGDAVIGESELVSVDEFRKANIEFIDARRNTQTMAAKVHIERKISGIRVFKVISEKIHKSMEPYIDDVITVICSLTNLKKSQNR